MQKLWLRIVTDKVNPIWWPVLVLLWIASLIYRTGLVVPNLVVRERVRVETPVISVGNLTTGGTGKTPVVIELARYFLSRKLKIGIVSSGYGRKSKTDVIGSGSDMLDMSPDDAGDEVLMMAQLLPNAHFSVSGSKSEAARLLNEKIRPDVIIVDDGFQHRKLYRDCDILLVEAGIDLKKEGILPFGRRREPLASMDRADVLILTKTNFAESGSGFRNWIRDQFRDRIVAELEFRNDVIVSEDERVVLEKAADEPVYFFAGIGSFTSLLNHLQGRLTKFVGFRQFPDHCRYRPSETARIKGDIEKFKPRYVITTFKDFIKIRSFDFGQPIYYLNLELRFESGAKALYEKLDSVIEKSKR